MDSILIIDRELETSLTLASLLQNSGYNTTAAETGEEALIHLFARRFDLVLLSEGLSDRDGLMLLPEIQVLDPHTPILVMISSNSVDQGVEAMRMGASDYLIKPLDPNKVVSYVHTFLNDRKTSH